MHPLGCSWAIVLREHNNLHLPASVPVLRCAGAWWGCWCYGTWMNPGFSLQKTQLESWTTFFFFERQLSQDHYVKENPFPFAFISIFSGSGHPPALPHARNGWGSREISVGKVKVHTVRDFATEGIKENSQSRLLLWTSFEISSFNGIISRAGFPFTACAVQDMNNV